MISLLSIHAAATLFMTGVIWFVQIVHYPLFGRIGGADFSAYERAHRGRTLWVVAPPMLLELLTGVALAVAPVPGAALAMRAGLAILALIWLSTMLFQAPEHERLSGGFTPERHRRLVMGNWFRTVAWTLRAALILSALPR